jgi:hypothetical protein
VECGIPMMHRVALTLFVVMTCFLASPAGAERSVMLVTNEACAMQTISMLDVRKAYLGISINYEGLGIRAFRLNNDEILDQVFFQTVVAMSEKSYERRLLSLLLKFGTPRPQELDSVEALAAAIRSTNCGIAYMWANDAESMSGIKGIRLLWQGD